MVNEFFMLIILFVISLPIIAIVSNIILYLMKDPIDKMKAQFKTIEKDFLDITNGVLKYDGYYIEYTIKDGDYTTSMSYDILNIENDDLFMMGWIEDYALDTGRSLSNEVIDTYRKYQEKPYISLKDLLSEYTLPAIEYKNGFGDESILDVVKSYIVDEFGKNLSKKEKSQINKNLRNIYTKLSLASERDSKKDDVVFDFFDFYALLENTIPLDQLSNININCHCEATEALEICGSSLIFDVLCFYYIDEYLSEYKDEYIRTIFRY